LLSAAGFVSADFESDEDEDDSLEDLSELELEEDFEA
jgi:hypothetical protein